MSSSTRYERATELLQQLGLREYEAMCFVALVGVGATTAREVSEASDVPRTRVYDAMRSLEAQGLVEVQHTSPQEFRAVSVTEAVETLTRQYDSRLSNLQTALERIDEAGMADDGAGHELQTLSGDDAVAGRVREFVDDAGWEVRLVVGTEAALDDDLFDALSRAVERGASVIVGVPTESARERVARSVPGTTAFVSGLEWLDADGSDPDRRATVSRLLLVDRDVALASTVGGDAPERAAFGQGFGTDLATVLQRMLETGLVRDEDDGNEGRDGHDGRGTNGQTPDSPSENGE